MLLRKVHRRGNALLKATQAQKAKSHSSVCRNMPVAYTTITKPLHGLSCPQCKAGVSVLRHPKPC